MANNNNDLVFYQQGAAAGQQIDKYSIQPGCVDSENLDIFSDSQAIKGMPWSSKEAVNNQWVDVDPKGRFYLASDGRVWDSKTNTWYNHDYFDENANQIKYTNSYSKAQFGTPKKLYVAYSGEEWMTISIITDRLIYNIYKNWVHIQKGDVYGFRNGEKCSIEGVEVSATGYVTDGTEIGDTYNFPIFSNTASQNYDTPGGFHSEPTRTESCMRMKVKFKPWGTFKDISIKGWKANFEWDNSKKTFVYGGTATLSFNETLNTLTTAGIEYELYYDNFVKKLDSYSSNSGLYFHGTLSRSSGTGIQVDYFKKEDWSYLYPKDRKIIEVEDDSFIEGMDSTQYFQYSYYALEDEDGNVYYQLTQTNELNLPDDQEIIAFARGFDYQYAFVNKGDIGIVYYMTDVNLATWDVGYRFIGTKFINAIMIGNYVYVLAEKRGVRGLYIFSNGDMKLLVGANNKYTEDLDLINGKEIFNFTGFMANWRDKVVCSTKDSVFMWGATKLGNNAGAFILKVDGEITDINTKRGYLDVYFTNDQTNYIQSIQDDVNIRNYESEFSVTYPVQISSHLVEKEPLSLALSYNLPNADTKLEAYISVNDNYFWSFLTDGEVTPEEGAKYKVSGLSGDYWLNFVEKKGNWLTFYLSGYLPYQTSNTKNLVSEDTEQTIAFTDFNHFKYLGEVKKEDPEEIDGKHTYLNLTTKNDLPIVRKAQVKIIGITDNHVTPEIYGIRLLSQQFDK